MAWNPNIPNQANEVRGAGGDLVKMQGNFAMLSPVVNSGINALISGGANISGAVPVAQSASADAPWFSRRLSLIGGDLSDVLAGTPTDGQIYKWVAANSRFELADDDNSGGGGGGGSGGAGESAKVALLTMVSGGTQLIASNTSTLVTGLTSTKRDTGGFTLSSGQITVPLGSGYTEVLLRAGVSYQSDFVGDGSTTFFQTSFRKNGTAGVIRDGTAAYTTVQPKHRGFASGAGVQQFEAFSPRIPVSGGEVFSVYTEHSVASGVDVIGGAAEEGTLTWFSVEAFTTSGVGAVQAPGEYICQLTMASGAVQTITTNTLTTVTGCNTVRRNVGGFTAASGEITIPTGSGYTHAQVYGQLAWAASSVGYRELSIWSDGAELTRTPDGTPFLDMFFRVAPSTSTSSQSYLSPPIPISGGQKFTLRARNTATSSLEVQGGGAAEGTLVALQVQCYKLVSGGTG